MKLGEINKGAVALLLVVMLGAGGYLWYSMLYKPAVAARVLAQAAAAQAESEKDAAQQELQAAQDRLADSRKASGKSDDSVARLAKARTAIPTKRLIDDAAIVLVELAERSGVQTAFSAGGTSADAASAAAGDLQGAVPVDLEFDAAGSYAEMMQFMSLVEGTVEAKDGKLFTRGRLFNVVKLEIGAPDEDETQQQEFGFSASEQEPASNQLNPGPNDILFKVTVRMYTSSTSNAEGLGAAAALDPAASGSDYAAGGDPAAAGADPAAGGDPAATGGTTNADGSTDPNATTTAPAATGATAAGGI